MVSKAKKKLECPFQSSSLMPYYCSGCRCALWREFNFGAKVGVLSGCAMAVTADLTSRLLVQSVFND